MDDRSGGSIQPERAEAYVVYDGDSGRILHVHEVVTLPGGSHPAPQEAESKALEIARRHAGQPGNLRTLRVRPDQLRPGVIHAVDLRTLSVLEKGPVVR